MSGFLALLDDVAAIAKLAAASADRLARQTAVAGVKAAGAVIDDAAVTPEYVTGLSPARELPIVWRIAKASFFNKLVILLPAALLMELYAPWLLIPLLMLGGAYLSFEGAEKVAAQFFPGIADAKGPETEAISQAHLEEKHVRGAIKTDFILSAEITAIALSVIEVEQLWEKGAVLALVMIIVTVAVYGAVALLVKLDDIGLKLARDSGLALLRWFGRRLLGFVPYLIAAISAVGAAALLWVSGEIFLHGLAELGHPLGEEIVNGASASVEESAGGLAGYAAGLALKAVAGLAVGLVLVLIFHGVLAPIGRAVAGLFGGKEKA